MASTTLRIFAIKDGFDDPRDLLKEPDKYKKHEVRSSGNDFIGMLYIRSTQAVPKWLDFVHPRPDKDALGLKNRSHSGVLLIDLNGRMFAITFGYGHHMVQPTVREERFGLRTVLNTINPERIKSIDHKKIEAVAIHARVQASRESTLQYFSVDEQRDLLKAITGELKDDSVGVRATGSDALAITSHVTVDTLFEKLEVWWERSTSDDYKKSFPWVDNIAEEQNPETRARLDEKLEKQIQQGEWSKIWMAVPSLMDWNNVDGFIFRTETQSMHATLGLDEYLRDPYRHQDDISIKQLRDDRVYVCLSNLDKPEYKWRVYQCICAELEHDGDRYILDEGKWYKLDRDFVNEVLAFYEGIPEVDDELTLPPCRGEKEADYNRRVEREVDEITSLDAKTVWAGVGYGRIEVCDLYHGPGRIFVHVKHYSGSSTLSHLFAQGQVAAESMLRDEEFRARATEKFPDVGLPVDGDGVRGYKVIYAIIAKPGETTVDPPFFSKVNIRTAVRRLKELGFNPMRMTIPNLGAGEED
ncbi:MAG: hypothetical protein F4Y74_11845 [Gemmatimonadales bacterium]|nr:hypothetical protein [Gemmatimonadales bacterium]